MGKAFPRIDYHKHPDYNAERDTFAVVDPNGNVVEIPRSSAVFVRTANVPTTHPHGIPDRGDLEVLTLKRGWCFYSDRDAE